MVAELAGGLRSTHHGWTSAQIDGAVLPYEWELIDGRLLARGRIDHWHRMIRKAFAAELGSPRRPPYAVMVDRYLHVDEFSVVRPDIAVLDEAAADLHDAHCPSACAAVLVVEIVSAATHSDDWFRKPRVYATAGIANFWRIERGQDDRPIVYQYWLDHESREYVPAPTFVHTGTLATAVPYRVRIDLAAIRTRGRKPEVGEYSARRMFLTGGGPRSIRSRRRCSECGGR
jgi:Uma2 family endonuclease